LATSAAERGAQSAAQASSQRRAPAAGASWLVFCPTSQSQFGVPARIDEWLEAQIPFLVASDSGNSNDGLSVQAELRWVAGFRQLAAAQPGLPRSAARSQRPPGPALAAGGLLRPPCARPCSSTRTRCSFAPTTPCRR